MESTGKKCNWEIIKVKYWIFQTDVGLEEIKKLDISVDYNYSVDILWFIICILTF